MCRISRQCAGVLRRHTCCSLPGAARGRKEGQCAPRGPTAPASPGFLRAGVRSAAQSSLFAARKGRRRICPRRAGAALHRCGRVGRLLRGRAALLQPRRSAPAQVCMRSGCETSARTRRGAHGAGSLRRCWTKTRRGRRRRARLARVVPAASVPSSPPQRAAAPASHICASRSAQRAAPCAFCGGSPTARLCAPFGVGLRLCGHACCVAPGCPHVDEQCILRSSMARSNCVSRRAATCVCGCPSAPRPAARRSRGERRPACASPGPGVGQQI